MDDKYLKLHREELRNNSASIVPICIVIDTSKSMVLYKDGANKSRIERLTEGIHEFLEEIKNDEILCDSVEIAIVTFNKEAHLLQEFATIDNLKRFKVPTCNFSGDTAKGVELALDVLQKEKDFLKANSKKYSQPWIVFMSDGRATASKDPVTGEKNDADVQYRLGIAQRKVRELERSNKLTVIPVLISELSDGEYFEGRNQMRSFTVSRRCKEIGTGNSQVSYRDFFKILSRSVSISNADLLFAEANAANGSGNNRVEEPEDYISSDEISRILGITEPVSTPPPSFTPTVTNDDDAEQITRLKRETSDAYEAEDSQDAASDGDIPEADGALSQEDEHTGSLAIPQDTDSSVTAFEQNNDEFIDSVLASLTNWDDI